MKRTNLISCLGVTLVVATWGCSDGGGGRPKNDSSTDGGTDRDSSAAETNDNETGVGPTTPVRLIVAPTAIMVTEGSPTMSMGTFTISLSRPWPAPITVSLVPANPNVATVFPDTFEFKANETNSPEMRVVAGLDDDTVDNNTTISIFSPETGSATVAVNVDDMDVQALLVTPTKVSMTEGRNETLNVRLAKRPASSVVVTLASSNAAKLTVGTTMLTFNAGNYSIPQAVTLTAPQDDDTNLDNVTVTFMVTGNIPASPVSVEITDDDAVNLDVTPANLSLVERSNTPGVIKVSLTRAPSADVTVTVASSATAKATVTPATLTFTPANFASVQMVQVNAVADNDSRDENVMVTLTATGVTPTPPSRVVAVAIDDPDNQALQVTPLAVTVGEGMSGTFDIHLLLNPGGPTTVNVFSQNPGKIEVLPPVLNFNESNFGTAQTVTVRSLQDDDLVNDSVNVTLVSAAATNVNVTVSVTDDDHQAVQLIPITPGDPLVMQETRAGGAASTSPLGVRLAFRPAATVTVALASSSSKLTLSRTSLTFTPSDYATTQFVTLTAPNDNDMADDTVRITATADGIPNATLGVEIRDIDVQNFDISGAPTAPIAEGSATASFKVNLTIVPTAPVTVYATSNKPTKASVSPESCVISAANFNAGCLFVVTAPQDDDTRDESVTIAVSDMVGNIASRSVAIAVHDDDTQSLDLVGPVAAVTEGAEITFTVRPHWNPVDTMTVNLFSSAPAKLEVSPSMLTFGADWMTPKTVTLRGLQDDDVADVMAMISLSSVVLPAAPAPVAVTVTDDDHQTIQLIPTPAGTTLTMTETQQGGAPSISPLGVRLAFRPGPTETVVVAVTVPTAQAGRLTVTGSPLTFNAGNFSMAQFVTLTAPHVNDQVSPTVTVSATGTGMPGIPVATLPVTITDTDTLNLMVSPAAIGPIGEGAGNATFTVKLTVTPPSAVTPSLAFNGAKLTASACPALASVNDVCTVTVAALQDDDARDDMETITISAAGISMAQTVGVTIDDDDTQAFNVTADGTAPVPNPIVITENVDATPPLNPGEFNTRPFVVRLAFNPLGPVSVTVTPSLSNQVTLSANGSPFAASVTFTLDSSTYATGRTVTVRGTEDLDLVDQNLSLRVSGDATVADAVVNVRKTDDDTQRLVLSAPPCGVPTVRRDPAVSPDPPADTGTSLSVPEGSSRAFCVSLGYEPNVTNTVTLMASAASFGVAPGTLSFTNADYFTGQEVAVTAPQDANAANESGSVTVSVVPLAPQKSVSVAIADDDRTLVVDVTASGGHVNSTSPPGITNCRVSSGDCTQNYMVNTAVVLEAIPDAGFEFVTFSTLGGGTDCGTTSPATVTMATSLTCVAQFQMLVVP